MLDEENCRLLIELSKDKMNELGWKEGEDLEMNIESKRLVLKPKDIR